MRALAAVLGLVFLAGCRTEPPPVALGDPAAWTAHPADGVVLRLEDDDGALRCDFRFTGGGWAIARREVDLILPENYEFRFRVRGEAPVNHLEFKLVDSSGQNVWWRVWRDLAWPAEWRVLTARKRQIEFAWGPQGGGEPARVATIEFAVTAGSGGEGTVWIDGLELVARSRVAGTPPAPVPSASSSAAASRAAFALDGDTATYWAADLADSAPIFALDLGQARAFRGDRLERRPRRPLSARDRGALPAPAGSLLRRRNRCGDRGDHAATARVVCQPRSARGAGE